MDHDPRVIYQVATRILAEDKEFITSPEYAGHQYATRVPAGEYPINLMRSHHGRLYLSCRMPGELAWDHFLNRVGPFQSLRSQSGGPSVYVWQPYAFELITAVDSGEAILSPGITIGSRAGSDGKEYRVLLMNDDPLFV